MKPFRCSNHFVLGAEFDKHNPKLGSQNIRDYTVWFPPHHLVNNHVIKRWIEYDIFEFAGVGCHDTMASIETLGF